MIVFNTVMFATLTLLVKLVILDIHGMLLQLLARVFAKLNNIIILHKFFIF